MARTAIHNSLGARFARACERWYLYRDPACRNRRAEVFSSLRARYGRGAVRRHRQAIAACLDRLEAEVLGRVGGLAVDVRGTDSTGRAVGVLYDTDIAVVYSSHVNAWTPAGRLTCPLQAPAGIVEFFSHAA